MRCGWITGGIWLLVAAVFGSGRSYADIPPELACGIAGRAAEQANLLPVNMLLSIGLVESGRADPVTGIAAAWPWTVNADGQGHYFATEQDAVAFARLAQSSGAGDVDVGCFQISLENHPDAFGSLDEAFDPVANANFAAGFLHRLKARSGSWDAAIADYHSAVPDLGLPYQRRVLAAWEGLGDAPPGLAAFDFAAPDPVVIMQAPEARLVRVITMSNDSGDSASEDNDSGDGDSGDGDSGPPMPAGLPRVITP